MARLQRKSTLSPEQVRTFPNGRVEVVSLDEFVVSHLINEPGWRWSADVKPIARTDSCELRHIGLVMRGRLHVLLDDGSELEFGPGDVYEIPPGHDGWVVGDDPWDTYEFTSGRTFAVAPDEGEARLATLLFTDIVDSTGQLQRLGDRRWREVLLEHNEVVRAALDRFRGREVTTTGDGFLAAFDGAARAVRCGLAIASAVVPLGIGVRVGVHTGEVEFVGGNVRGLAVHLAARVMAAAGPGQVIVSALTQQLAAGSGLTFESAGQHELKGIAGSHELFRVVG
jgi:class 3 adenylate cyclase